MTSNKSGVEPLEYNLIVEMVELAHVSRAKRAGLHLPDQHADRAEASAQVARVVAVSPLAFDFVESWPEGMPKPVVGDLVLIKRFSAVRFENLRQEAFYVVKDKDIQGFITDAAAYADAEEVAA